MDKKEFLKAVRLCRRKMNIAAFLKRLLSALCIGMAVGILFQAAAFATPLYYAGLYAGLALFLAAITAAAVSALKQTTMEQAALRMDSFGFEERIVTAYENLYHETNLYEDQAQEADLIVLQREDAMRQLREHGDKIRIPLLPSGKSMLFLLGLVIILTGLAFVPSKTKEYARELHSLREETREKEDEIEEIVEALEALKQEELTPQQQASLQDMIDSLQSSLSEYHQASSEEMVSAASEKLNYKYENINSQLSAMAQSIQNGATVSDAAAESMEAMSKKLREINGQELAKGNGSGSDQGQNGQGGQDSNSGQGSDSGQGGDGGQNGQGGDGGQNGQDGDSGQGGGSGQGSDGESGNGRGTGSSSTPHDYVSIPNAIADNGNLTGNAVNHDASEYFYAQNGLSWEGTHMSHEAVIGSYEQNAYEGIAAGKYPSGMEDIIKEYFSSF